jgi:Asp-tRNA(Asn)/Glu-tRNA(Gln) amidotransferase A subunit family amidase
MGTDSDAILALDACALRDRLATGALRAIELVDACIARIEAREPEIRAWAWFDPEFARQQARALDEYRATGRAIGPLHGLPVGVKDIIDTARIPTENGASVDAGRKPAADAFVVDRLKAAGAVVMGKTVSTELAYLTPGPTRNPANPDHTPGGSSSGSAAAVAAGMVPLAIGTQTGGSVIRPAAFCGVTGFKPTFGAIPRTGVLTQSPSLDTVGVFARTPADAALLAEALFGHDPLDKATAPAPHPALLRTALAAPPLPPTFAFVRPPGWDDADPQVHDAFAELIELLGEQVFEAPLPNAYSDAAALRERVNFAEMARCYYRYARDGMDALGAETQAALRAGAAITARDYLAALDWAQVLYAGLAEIFQRADAILCPATLGPAPKGLSSTGSAIFNGLWTFVGAPAVTIPAFVSVDGLPMGAQIVGPRGDDARLLRTARWLQQKLGC